MLKKPSGYKNINSSQVIPPKKDNSILEYLINAINYLKIKSSSFF